MRRDGAARRARPGRSPTARGPPARQALRAQARRDGVLRSVEAAPSSGSGTPKPLRTQLWELRRSGRPTDVGIRERFCHFFTGEDVNNLKAVLGARMLEVCPSIAHHAPRCEVHPLSIGGREDPVRLVCNAAAGAAVNVSVVNLGDRFGMTTCEREEVEPPHPLPELPVARALWRHEPDLATAAEAWIMAGTSHHSGHSTAVTIEHIEDFARMHGVELITFDGYSGLRAPERELRWNDAAYRLGER